MNRVPAITRVADEGALASDGLGAYVNGIDNVVSMLTYKAVGLRMFSNTNTSARPRRAVRVDLSRPVSQTGAVPRGVIVDSSAEIFVFYHVDRTAGALVYNLDDIPVGTTVTSELIEVHVSQGGQRHLLLLGNGNYPFWLCGGTPWVIVPTGTDAATIRRDSADAWTIVAPTGARAHMYREMSPEPFVRGGDNWPTSADWVDEGRYYFGFRLVVTRPK